MMSVLTALGTTAAATDPVQSAVWLAPTITVAVALFGIAGAYFTNRAMASRAARLARIDRQLSEYYGPLLAMASASNHTWREFRAKYRPPGRFWDQDDPPTDVDAAAWRLWMETVFMPTNRRIRDVITDKADLLLDEQIPSELLTVCAQVASYEAILKLWSHNDFREHKTAIQFPGHALIDYAAKGFTMLKDEQLRLLEKRWLRFPG